MTKKFGVRYPWDHWFKCRPLTLYKGRDYDIKTYSMAQMIRTAAKARGLTVEIKTGEDEAYLLVTVSRGKRA